MRSALLRALTHYPLYFSLDKGYSPISIPSCILQRRESTQMGFLPANINLLHISGRRQLCYDVYAP
jgi:hypothetical protein